MKMKKVALRMVSALIIIVPIAVTISCGNTISISKSKKENWIWFK